MPQIQLIQSCPVRRQAVGGDRLRLDRLVVQKTSEKPQRLPPDAIDLIGGDLVAPSSLQGAVKPNSLRRGFTLFSSVSVRDRGALLPPLIPNLLAYAMTPCLDYPTQRRRRLPEISSAASTGQSLLKIGWG